MIWVQIAIVGIAVMALCIAAELSCPEYVYYVYVEELEKKEED